MKRGGEKGRRGREGKEGSETWAASWLFLNERTSLFLFLVLFVCTVDFSRSNGAHVQRKHSDTSQVTKLRVSIPEKLQLELPHFHVFVDPSFCVLLSLYRFQGQGQVAPRNSETHLSKRQGIHLKHLNSLDRDQDCLTYVNTQHFCLLCRSVHLADRCDAGSVCLMCPVSVLGPEDCHKLQNRSTKQDNKDFKRFWGKCLSSHVLLTQAAGDVTLYLTYTPFPLIHQIVHENTLGSEATHHDPTNPGIALYAHCSPHSPHADLAPPGQVGVLSSPVFGL